MAKKSGLGKGLEALFIDNSSDESFSATNTLKLTQIEPNKDQPRKMFNQEALEELADSIREHGLISPILVKPTPAGRYVIIAGERRWRASRMAGLTDVPVIIRDFSELEAMELALIENLQREDLNPIEEARGYSKLITEFNLTQEDVAKRVGKSRPSITNSLRILSLPEKTIKAIENNNISTGHGKVLLGIENEKDIIEATELITKKDLSVRETEVLVKRLKEAGENGQKIRREIFTEDSFFKEAELALREHLGRKINIINGKKKQGKQLGKLEIEYFSKEDLTEIIKKLETF